MTVQILLFCLGIVVLYFGAEALVRGAARLADSLGISPIVVGLTVVSLGTSAPELAVGIFAVLEGNGDLAVGNVLGSNLANIGLILGLSAMVRPLSIAARVVSREIPIMVAVTAFLYPLILDLELGRRDGVVLLGVLLLYLLFVGLTAREETPEVLGEYEKFAEDSAYVTARTALRDLGMVVVGAAGVVLGADLIVDSALFVARAVGISEMTIGLTVVAVGTSLPELATSVVAAFREEADIAVGNIIGSNIFNVAAVLGAVASLRPLAVPGHVLTVELPAVLVLSALLLPVAFAGMEIRRWEGMALLAIYGGIFVWVFV